MIIKAGLLTIISSLVLLFPSVGKVHNEPAYLNFKPVKVMAIKAPTLPVVEPAVAVPTAPVVTYTAPPVSSVYSGSGDQYLDFIVAHESGGNAFAVNPYSGACGLAQELPCGKSGCSLGDATCELNWMRSYCISRYGSTYDAYLYWIAHGNY